MKILRNKQMFAKFQKRKFLNKIYFFIFFKFDWQLIFCAFESDLSNESTMFSYNWKQSNIGAIPKRPIRVYLDLDSKRLESEFVASAIFEPISILPLYPKAIRKSEKQTFERISFI